MSKKDLTQKALLRLPDVFVSLINFLIFDNCPAIHPDQICPLDIPNINLSTLINSLKTASSRMVRKNFPKELDSYYWKPYFWSHSYFLATVSERNTEAVNKYIENQGVHNKKEAHVSRH